MILTGIGTAESYYILEVNIKNFPKKDFDSDESLYDSIWRARRWITNSRATPQFSYEEGNPHIRNGWESSVFWTTVGLPNDQRIRGTTEHTKYISQKLYYCNARWNTQVCWEFVLILCMWTVIGDSRTTCYKCSYHFLLRPETHLAGENGAHCNMISSRSR